MVKPMYENACVCVCVTDLSRRFNTPDEAEKDNEPGYSQATQDRET